MALTPEDVVNKRFQATKFREGYDQDEVDDFLDEVVNELRRLYEENEELHNKLGACERRVGELSRAAAMGGQGEPEMAQPQSVAAVVQPPQPVMAEARGSHASADPRSQLEAAASGPQGPEQAAGMLALAQKLHDEYVRNGEQQRDRILSEARERANHMLNEAEEKQRQTLGSLEQERSLLERKIDELRSFEREYRSRLKSYLEGQLRDLEAKAAVVPNRGPQASSGSGGSYAGNGQLPSRSAAATFNATEAQTPEPAGQSYPFGSQS